MSAPQGRPPRIRVEPQTGGHAAVCACGWQSRAYPVPDTAYVAGVRHAVPGN